MFSLSGLEKYAESRLDSNTWGYYSSGANLEQTLSDNEKAFQRYRLRPRMLRDVSAVDMKTSVLGQEISFPVGVGATSSHRLAHEEGELATARAAATMDTCMILSVWTNTNPEDVADTSSTGLRWFQLYIFKNRELTKRLVLRAEKAGYKAIMVTIDQPIVGKRTSTYIPPPHISFPNFNITNTLLVEDVEDMFDPSITWKDIEWIKGLTSLPVVVKGVLTAEDAREAVRHGVQGIIVSNHGGRQLDGVLATIDVLSEVVGAVEGHVEVFMDGGVRQGTDVLKALALGARAVFIGRPVLWGLAYNGEEGVVSVLEMLREDFKRAMMLSGCGTVAEIQPSLVVHESVVNNSAVRM